MSPKKVSILLTELEFAASRSSGPGGQNVNKRSTQVQLRWAFHDSTVLTERQKERLQSSRQFRRRINADGLILLQEGRARTQAANKRLVLARLERLLQEALRPPKRRIKTAVPKASREARLQTKTMRQKKKRLRRKDLIEN